MDGLARVNGELMDEPVSAPASALAPFAGHSTQDIRDVSLAQQEDSSPEVPGTGRQAEKTLKEEETKSVKTEERRPSPGVEQLPEPPQRDQEAEALQREERAEEQQAPRQSEEQSPSSAAPPPPPSQKVDQTPPKPPRHPDSVPTFSGSAISSLIGGRNCVITTTIVTELTQTQVEPLEPDCHTNGQVACSAAGD